jgi:hypothetical protein
MAEPDRRHDHVALTSGQSDHITGGQVAGKDRFRQTPERYGLLFQTSAGGLAEFTLGPGDRMLGLAVPSMAAMAAKPAQGRGDTQSPGSFVRRNQRHVGEVGRRLVMAAARIGAGDLGWLINDQAEPGTLASKAIRPYFGIVGR